MYVCVCNAVTERQVQKAIDTGVTTVKALGRDLGVGTQCGLCASYAKECLSKARKLDSKYPANVIPICKQEVA